MGPAPYTLNLEAYTPQVVRALIKAGAKPLAALQPIRFPTAPTVSTCNISTFKSDCVVGRAAGSNDAQLEAGRRGSNSWPAAEREIFIANLLARVHWIIEMIVEERPFAMGV